MSIRVETVGDATFLLGAVSGDPSDAARALDVGAACLKALQAEIAPDLDLIFARGVFDRSDELLGSGTEGDFADDDAFGI